jgi:hypothetical protein
MPAPGLDPGIVAVFHNCNIDKKMQRWSIEIAALKLHKYE